MTFKSAEFKFYLYQLAIYYITWSTPKLRLKIAAIFLSLNPGTNLSPKLIPLMLRKPKFSTLIKNHSKLTLPSNISNSQNSPKSPLKTQNLSTNPLFKNSFPFKTILNPKLIPSRSSTLSPLSAFGHHILTKLQFESKGLPLHYKRPNRWLKSDFHTTPHKHKTDIRWRYHHKEC
jgi:hypothetical protein